MNMIIVGIIGLTYLLSTLVAQEATPAVGHACGGNSSTHVNKDKQFLQCLLKSYDWKSKLSSRTEVTIAFHVQDVVYIQMYGILYMSGDFAMEWQDDNFTWGKNDFVRRTLLLRNPVGVWKPEIYLNKLSNYGTDRRISYGPLVSDRSGGAMEISGSGKVRYHLESILMIACPRTDLSRFPFEVNECCLELFSPLNVTFKLKPETTLVSPYNQKHSVSTHQIVDSSITVGSLRKKDTQTSLLLYLKLVRFEEVFNIKLHAPNLGLCILLLIPLWLSPANVLRLILPTLSFLFTLYQLQTLHAFLWNTFFAEKILMLEFYRSITVLSLLMLAHNFYSCLFWRRKLFLPAPLNRMYAQLYALDVCKKLTHVETYLEIERETPENTENLEATFHTWSELLRVVDMGLFLVILPVEMYFYLPTTVKP
ncbi:hypothetical protein M8J77_026447 [Diaphorina citri]|nr:hypothetical protein M8J77_026447 [Diaphorina citri]